MNLGIHTQLMELRARIAQLEELVLGHTVGACAVCGGALIGRADKVYCSHYHRTLASKRARRGIHPCGCRPDGSVWCDRAPDCGAGKHECSVCDSAQGGAAS